MAGARSRLIKEMVGRMSLAQLRNLWEEAGLNQTASFEEFVLSTIQMLEEEGLLYG